MQIWAESGKSALPICNYSQILYQFLMFTQNLKRSRFIRFYDSHSALWASHRAGIYRQRTEENVLKVQLVNFHRLIKS